MSKEKRMAGSYEIEQSIYIGEKEVLFGVNKAEEYPFMVCLLKKSTKIPQILSG